MTRKIIIILLLIVMSYSSMYSQEKKYKLMEFRNANIHSVLNYMSDLTGLTIIPHPKLKGKVTIINKEKLSLNDIIGILYSSLKELDFTIDRQGNLLKIVPLSKTGIKTEIKTDEDINNLPDGDQIITQIITLKYVQVDTIVNNIKPFLSKFGNLSINKKMNKVIITDTASNIKKIFKIIKELDRVETLKGKQVKIIYLKYISLNKMEKIILDGYYDVKIIDTAYPSLQKLSPRRGKTRKEPSLKLIKMTEANAFLAIGSKEEVDGIKNFISKIDIEIKPSGDVKLRIIALKYVKPDKMVEFINQIFFIEEDGSKQRRSYRRPSKTQTKGKGYIPLSSTSKVIEFPERNALIIISTEKDYKKIKEVVDVFEEEIKDAGYKAGEVMTKVYHLQNQKAEDIAQIFRSIQRSDRKKGSKDDPVFFADKNVNAMIVVASSEKQLEIGALLDRLDKKLSQVLIKVLIVEVSYTDETKIGVDWEQIINVPNSTAKGKIPNISVSQKFDTSASSGLTFESTKKNFILNMLQTVGDVNVLSSPHILTLDNKEASINIGKKIAFVSEEVSISGQNEDNVTSKKKITYRDVGLKLIVKPHINDEKSVTLEIKQEINDTDPSGNPDYPNISTKEINSTIMVKDNKTAVLGGLMSTKETVDEKRVPILGYIPLIKYLFSSSVTREEKTELMLFITPYVIYTDADLKNIKDKTIQKFENLTDEQKKELGIQEED